MSDYLVTDTELTETADAIRAKTSDANLIEWESGTGFADAIAAIPSAEYHPNAGEHWKPPAEWPDLSSVSLPDSADENTIYLLYEKSLGFDEVQVRRVFDRGTMTVYKGTIANGEFVGEVFASNKLTDTLTDQYTVYKLVGTYVGLAFDFRATYAKSVQSVVWIRGNAPLVAYYTNPGIHTVSVELYNCRSAYNMDGYDSPATSSTLKKFWVGYGANGRFNDVKMGRTGNGPMFYQPLEDDATITIENATISWMQGAFNVMRNVAFKNVTATMRSSMFGGGVFLKSVAFLTTGVTCSDMRYQFNGCTSLEYCDLSKVDFTSATDSGSAFNGCQNLKTLVLNNTWTMPLPLSQCYKLSKESILDIFRVLPTIDTAKTISLPYTLKDYILSDDEKAIATEKGWTVA